MDYSEFIGEVQHRIEASDQGDAVGATRAVLTTLGERLQGGEATDLAAPLPEEVGRYLREAHSGQQFDYDEFISRVAERANLDEADAAFASQAVVHLLWENVPAGERSDVVANLPAEFDDLFEFVDAEETPY